MIRRAHLLALCLAACLTLHAPARAQPAPVTIGIMVTLSGPGAVLGQHARDGFQLFVTQHGGKLGGRDAQIIVVDDELKPDTAVARARRLVESDHADFVVGPIFSNVLGAIVRPVTQAGAFLISPNAGPSTLAGKGCTPNLFVTSYENTQVHQISGQVAQERGYKRAFLMAPNYQAGRDAIEGFKSAFKGEILEEDFVPLTQIDFQADLANIAAAKPDVIYAFMPGGLGVNLVKQFHQSGMADTIPFLSAFTVDESTLPAQQDAAIGLYGGMTWAPNAGNPANAAFVKAFMDTYHYVPASYAAHAYDAAQLIDSALRHTGGDTADKDRLRAALAAADFASVRGAFRFNTNHFPVQDFYLTRVAKRPDGLFETQITERVFHDYGDHYAAECPMK
jgi:branched-chain amino acid transport system substrate-binding protein